MKKVLVILSMTRTKDRENSNGNKEMELIDLLNNLIMQMSQQDKSEQKFFYKSKTKSEKTFSQSKIKNKTETPVSAAPLSKCP